VHWVADCHAVDATMNLYSDLFTVDEPLSEENKDHWLDFLNKESLIVTQASNETPATLLLLGAHGHTHAHALTLSLATHDPTPRALVCVRVQGKVEAAIVADGLEYDGSKIQSFQFTRQGYFCVDKVWWAELRRKRREGGREATRSVQPNMGDADCTLAV
jgi:hypothetical protein